MLGRGKRQLSRCYHCHRSSVDVCGRRKKGFWKRLLYLVFCLTSLLLTSGKFRSCSCSWKKPRRRSRSCGSRYVLRAAMLWEMGGSPGHLLHFSHVPSALRKSQWRNSSTHSCHSCRFLPHTQTAQCTSQCWLPLPLSPSEKLVLRREDACESGPHPFGSSSIVAMISLSLST